MEGGAWTVTKALITTSEKQGKKIILSKETGKAGEPHTLAWQFLSLGALFCDLSSKNIKTLGYMLDNIIVKVKVASQEVLFAKWKRTKVALKDILYST